MLRVIPRLDVKGPNLVKGIHLEGLRVIGDPSAFARRYYDGGADELLIVDIVASLYGRNNLLHIVERVAEEVFVPLTVGGGIRSLDDIHQALRAGADKVSINTAATRRPEFVREAALRFGSSNVAVTIEAMRRPDGRYEAYTDNGRQRTRLDVVEWAAQVAELGAGELIITSIEREGTRRGFDATLARAVTDVVDVPVVLHGGAGSLDDITAAAATGVDALAIASMLHYNETSIAAIKERLAEAGVEVRR